MFPYFFSFITFQVSYDLWVVFEDTSSSSGYKETGVVFPKKPPAPAPTPKEECVPTTKDLRKAVEFCDGCVLTTKGLRKAVEDCDSGTNETCLIDICSNRLPMSASSSSRKGIDLSNKNIYLRCDQQCAPKRCIFDGLGITRLFYGSNANITFLNFIFANGFHESNGGAIKLENSSIATMINCSFVNNSALSGSAVQVNNSLLIVSGIETSLINNTGISPPLEVLSSQLNISQAVFADNQVSEYLADILLFNSNISIYDVHFLNSRTVLSKDCHIYFAMVADDYANKSSCMNVDPSNKSFPVIDVSDYCPSSPTLSPISPPSPALCFSGRNFVEIQHVGHVPMSQLRIGDYVKSGEDKFTQVYGFGHFDHNRDGVFLQITLHSEANDEAITSQASSLSMFLEVSPPHLIMIEKNHKQYRVPAREVRVDDILSGHRVKSIQEVIRHGVYAPLTQSGDILINCILASNYVDLISLPSMILLPDQHTLAYILFFPQRMFCRSFLELCKKEIYVHGYGQLAYLLLGGSSFINIMMPSVVDPTLIFWFFFFLCMLIVVLVRRRN
jgi:Hint module